MDFFKKIQGQMNVDSSKTVSQLENKYDALFDSVNKKIEADDKELDAIKTKLDKHEQQSIHKDELLNKENGQKIESGGVSTLNSKIEKKYRDNQIVKGNSYCYIGTDNGQRECTNAYAGDVCMSGQIFPKMEICINPNLRL